MHASDLSISENRLSSEMIILLVDDFVLVEIQFFIGVVRPIIPILEHKIVAEAH